MHCHSFLRKDFLRRPRRQESQQVPHRVLPTQARFTDRPRAAMGPMGVGESFSRLGLFAPGASSQSQARFANPLAIFVPLELRVGFAWLDFFAPGALPKAQARFADPPAAFAPLGVRKGVLWLGLFASGAFPQE